MEYNQLPLVSIITVQYGQQQLTELLIESLMRITYPNIELFVVDNASPHSNPDDLVIKYPHVRLIKSHENLGFAGGNNLAIRKAKGEFILLLNNDTEVEPGFLEPLVNKFKSDPTLGAVSPKIRFFSSPNTIQFVGMTEMNTLSMSNKSIGYCTTDVGQYETDQETCFAHGAAMMVPMKVIREVGLLAEIYFLYYEELDWGRRIRNRGYKIGYVHNSLIYHKESMTTGAMSPLKTYYLNRSRLIYLRRNVQGVRFLVSLIYWMFISFPKNVLSPLFKGEFKLLNAYISAVKWHLSHLFDRSIYQNEAFEIG